MNSKDDLPIISCICITANRTEMLFKSILAFGQQNYPRKELVVSYPNTDQPTKILLEYLGENTNINLLKVERVENCTLGEARNQAIEHANGVYICIWDDDDLHHEHRLTEQFNSLNVDGKTMDASLIAQILLFQVFNQTAYMAFPSYWSCTLLCLKELVRLYPFLNQNQFESKPLLTHLTRNGLASLIYASPHLYTHVFHGRNLMKYTSFLYIINKSTLVRNDTSEAIRDLVSQKVAILY